MEASILINRAHGETRVALLEDGVVAEIYIERDHELGFVGNIYKGRVLRVLPGMQAAFVDVGLEKAAFLYVDDIVTGDPPHEADDPDEGEGHHHGRPPAAERPSITQLIREGQELICQVTKDPLGTKGARVSTYVSIPGRHVVYMPTMRHIGVSRRITDDGERKRLRAIIEANRKPNEGGFIVRTVSTGLEGDRIIEDMEFVRSLWSEIQERSWSVPAPALLQSDLDLVLRSTRDLFTRDVSKCLVDSPKEAERIKKLLGKFAPHLMDRVQLFEDDEPIFDHFGIEPDLERALMRKISLKSGGSIIIDEAEALTAIDVNTGSFVGSRNLEATILKTNLEAAREIVAQLRLRNLGGIIIVDFIDMEEPENRAKVYDAFNTELAKDRAKTHVLPMSGLGLVEMTRKRVRPSLGKTLTEPCPYCDGRGRIRSKKTICRDVFREIDRQAHRHSTGTIVVNAMPEVAAMFTEDEYERLLELESQLGRSIVIEASSDLHQEVYQVSVRHASSMS
ncbi:Rne/Rng family ribonuclease [Myxococcota bacterium]|nr:Rne/Rng family ribonuclease [Myxococcota bacterium]